MRKHLVLILLLVVCLLGLFTGCTININIGTLAGDASEESAGKNIFDYIFHNQEETKMYESRATIFISYISEGADTAATAVDPAVSASLPLMGVFNGILQSKTIQSQIQKEYPDVAYALSLEPVNETSMYTLIATGENPEYLDEICNMAISVFCEELPRIVDGVSIKIIDYAKPVQ